MSEFDLQHWLKECLGKHSLQNKACAWNTEPYYLEVDIYIHDVWKSLSTLVVYEKELTWINRGQTCDTIVINTTQQRHM